MGWWGYHTNEGDSTQDAICEMTDKLHIKNNGFGDRLDMIASKIPSKSNEENNVEILSETIEAGIEFQIETKTEEIFASNITDDEKSISDSEYESIINSEDAQSEPEDADPDNEYFKDDPKDVKWGSWWMKRHLIEKYVFNNLKSLSRDPFLIAGISWELHKRSDSKSLHPDFPERLRLLAKRSVEAYYEEMNILISTGNFCKNNDECFRCLQQEIDIFSRK